MEIAYSEISETNASFGKQNPLEPLAPATKLVSGELAMKACLILDLPRSRLAAEGLRTNGAARVAGGRHKRHFLCLFLALAYNLAPPNQIHLFRSNR